MKIGTQFLDVNGTQDIFGYFRTSFKSSDLNADGIVTLYTLGTVSGDEEYRSTISTLINERDNYRWVSPPNSSFFTINFHNTYIDLLYYSLETHPKLRFIKQWAIYGIRGSREYLIDKRDNEPLCPETFCSEYTIKTFKCQYPGSFTKFKMIGTGPDSNGDNMLSLSAIQFFGVINPHLPLFTCQKCLSFKYSFLFCSFLFIK